MNLSKMAILPWMLNRSKHISFTYHFSLKRIPKVDWLKHTSVYVSLQVETKSRRWSPTIGWLAQSCLPLEAKFHNWLGYLKIEVLWCVPTLWVLIMCMDIWMVSRPPLESEHFGHNGNTLWKTKFYSWLDYLKIEVMWCVSSLLGFDYAREYLDGKLPPSSWRGTTFWT